MARRSSSQEATGKGSVCLPVCLPVCLSALACPVVSYVRLKVRLPLPPQTEDKPLLPLPMDGAVDRREWTLQHHKAADITLTPPQADLDTDCLDVNVKGPGAERCPLVS